MPTPRKTPTAVAPSRARATAAANGSTATARSVTNEMRRRPTVEPLGGEGTSAPRPLITGLPDRLAFAAMFAVLPGSLVGDPFSLLLLAALTTQIGTLQLAPDEV